MAEMVPGDTLTPEDDRPPRIERDLSWIGFNGRVLGEAADPSVPLLERLHFLSIFSSNLDEFFRVRVAGLRALLRLEPHQRGRLPLDPAELLAEIHRRVLAQQERYGALIRDEVLPALAEAGVHLRGVHDVSDSERAILARYFEAEVRPHLRVIALDEPDDDDAPIELDDHALYLVVGPLHSTPALAPGTQRYRIVTIPSPPLHRFIRLGPDGASAGDEIHLVFLDDLVRLHLDRLFPDSGIGPDDAWAIKLSRDADLGLDEAFDGDLAAAVRHALSRRAEGVPARFLFDSAMPAGLIDLLQRRLALEHEDLIEGGRYHNLEDLRTLPAPADPDLRFPPWPPAPHPELVGERSIFEVVAEADQLLHLPYQSYDAVVRFFREAATDDAVEEIWMTVYRVATDSVLLGALEEAARRGVGVHVFFEVQARFDEASNLEWADRIEAAGGSVLFGTPERKVHAKVALVRRREGSSLRNYALLGTGNFNEVTARFYTDFNLFTARPAIADEVHLLFRYLDGEVDAPLFEHLVVAPFGLRETISESIRAEAEAAREGRPAGIEIKMNALEDPGVIATLHHASRMGVPIRALVRGIACLAPGRSGWSEEIEVRSIIGRYLEHARIYRFHADGDDRIWLASADWMTRNLNRRVEVAFPILDARLADQLRDILRIQWEERPRVHRIDSGGESHYAFPESTDTDPQHAHWRYVHAITAGAPRGSCS
ncbi:MAG: polyphosphate kinase 1 [Longimicrobiales bacterium]|nr:polyphosphate kinase 1 [Longimicrobiales bacterium]